MGYIIKEIKFENKQKALALFDSGSMFTYILHSAIPKNTITIPIEKEITARLAGDVHKLKSVCLIKGYINGYEFLFHAYPIDKIGTINFNGKKVEIEIIIGAPSMEEWEISLDMKKQELDLSGLKRRDFTSF